MQAAPGDASANPALRETCCGLPDAKLRWQIARSPAAPGGVEIIEVTDAGGTQLDRRANDVGAATLFVTGSRSRSEVGAGYKSSARPWSREAVRPIENSRAAERGRASSSCKDPAGHFVQIMQREPLPPTQAPPTANVVGRRGCGITVADVASAVRLYGDALGLERPRCLRIRLSRWAPALSTDLAARPRRAR